MLEIKNLCVSVGGKEILNNFNLVIPDGEIHALMGPNGVGKSTICKVMMRDENYEVTSGSILWDKENIINLDTSQVARKGFYLLSQNPIAIEGVTNAEMLRAALNARSNEAIHVFAFQKKLEEICKKLDIPKEFIHREINVGMSGGERKKNELLHLWVLEPKFILLDEVDSGLDVDALKIVASSLKEYQEKMNATILIITHHEQILDILRPNRVHIMKDGKIIKEGDSSLVRELENIGFKNMDEAFFVSEDARHE